MKSLILLALCSLPSTFSMALKANTTLPTTTTLPVLPPPSQYTQADVARNCARWDKIGSPGPYRCTDVMALYPEVSFSDLTLWNPSVGPICDNMWNSYWFCSAISGVYVPPPSQTPAGVPIKAPGIPQGPHSHPDTCDRWDEIVPGASCQTFMSRYPGLTVSNLQSWNPVIIVGTNPCFLQMSFYLCTSIVDYSFPAPSPVPPQPTLTGPPAPGPTQEGVTAACQKWDMVEPKDSCDAFISEYGVTLEELVSWNPAIGPQCTNLWGGYAVCVGV